MTVSCTFSSSHWIFVQLTCDSSVNASTSSSIFVTSDFFDCFPQQSQRPDQLLLLHLICLRPFLFFDAAGFSPPSWFHGPWCERFSKSGWRTAGGNCLGAEKSSKKLYSTLEKISTTPMTPSQGILSRDFPTFEGKKKFYYRHSPKQCIQYSLDSRAHFKIERRLCFPTSNRLETWFLPSGPTWSRQYHESTMVWHNLPS